MISFACKRVGFDELLMCSFGLTKGEYRLLMLLLERGEESNIKELSRLAGVDRSTSQKSISNLMKKELVMRRQVNQPNGGYFFYYSPIRKELIKQRMVQTLKNWNMAVERAITEW